MSVIISWDSLLTPRRLPAGDLIRLTVVDTPFSPDVQFMLRAAPRITWKKRIRFFDSTERAFLETVDNRREAGPASFSTTAFANGMRVELVKAMAFNVLTGVYELTDINRWKGSLLIFEWLED